MTRDPLIRAWTWLMALSLASTTLAAAVERLAGLTAALAGAAILILAWAKARIILSDYLGLSAAPFWRRGFAITLALYMSLLLVMALIPVV